MAERERKGLVARWLEGKERSEEYARSTLPTSRWALFWDIFKGRFWKLVLVNLLVLLTFLPLFGIIFWRSVSIAAQGLAGPFGAGLGIGYPALPDLIGVGESMVLQADLFFYALMIPAAILAGLGISGGMYIIRNMIWTEGIFVANDFARGIKRNFWNVTEAVLIFMVVFYMVNIMGDFANLLIASGTGSTGWLIASQVVGYVFLGLAILVCLWMISLGVNYKQGPWALFRNAVMMTVGTIIQTVVFAAVALLPFIIMFLTGGTNIFFVIALMLVVFFAFSYAMLVWMSFSQWAFDRFVNPQMGYTVGKGLYDKNRTPAQKAAESAAESAALREYKRQIVAQGRSKLVCRPIKPIDDDLEIYQLPESFSRDDLRRLKESKQAVADDVAAFEEEHKNDEQYVEYNRQFDERERALQEEEGGGKKKKKKAPTPPKMLNKRK
ncbi:MAG: hypothetical protein HFE26_02015 [Clostridia bacterium]|nr:hypothetical protein [Clostridia bacterium]